MRWALITSKIKDIRITTKDSWLLFLFSWHHILTLELFMYNIRKIDYSFVFKTRKVESWILHINIYIPVQFFKTFFLKFIQLTNRKLFATKLLGTASNHKLLSNFQYWTDNAFRIQGPILMENILKRLDWD